MKKQMAITVAKIAKKMSRLMGKGGGNIPGVVARKVDKLILKKLSNKVENIILVTGTNGKTTTSNLLASIMEQTNIPYINNAEGNNLISGIASTFVAKANLKGELKHNFAVIEVDEGSLHLVLKEVKPKAIIVNNFFRDQLDRYGEIDTLISKIEKSIEPIDTTLILNADDPFVVRLGKLKKETIYYGLNDKAYEFEKYEMSESKFCPTCGKELKYKHIHFGQLGYFACTCGFNRPNPYYEVTKIYPNLSFDIENDTYKLNIAGVYNIYNALAAISCSKYFNIGEKEIKSGIKEYQSENGRMESFSFEEKPYILNLVKNPAGVNITLSELFKNPEEQKQIVLFLNDLDHDARDISWIWDADFERIVDMNISNIICSGTRAHDMALRLKYAGIEESLIDITPSKEEAIEKALKNKKKTYLLPTYTALEPVKKYLEKRKA